MLHFPSANSAAHRPSDRDVAILCGLLDDDVWAFSNCRVDAPGKPVAEIDWLFYNVRHGTLMVSEWKGFPQRVVSATDTGEPWRLDGGMAVPNPIEQVSRQLDAVRSVLRAEILPQHFPAFDPQQLLLMQSVYSPQVDGRTAIERIRWGKVYGSLPALAAVISNSTSRSPLVMSEEGARLRVATALCALFRTTSPAEVKAKLRGPLAGGDTDFVQRISAIHRQIAALHVELADLTLIARGSVTVQPRPAATRTAPAPVSPTLTEHQRMNAHLAQSFQGVNGNSDAAAKALAKAWKLVLADRLLHGETGISISLFGSVGTPLVKRHHGSLPKVLGMPLRKWCVLQARAAGMKPLDVPGKPSNIRVR
ncbi:UNVERIFIED_ORG: hypothetical protein ABIB13_002660 [Arthrobacter sp. UYEF2]